ncbi:hypothetical protein BT93_H3523 [Corymbia citriodora subsp. variegata]|nr:hypothetical protein BT93_H3523 [Corymbia citriodora subsp. variegata]
MNRNWWCSRKAIEESGVAISHYLTEQERRFISLRKDTSAALFKMLSIWGSTPSTQMSRLKSLHARCSCWWESNHGPEVQKLPSSVVPPKFDGCSKAIPIPSVFIERERGREGGSRASMTH